MLHLEDMISYIIGHFRKLTKDTFYHGNLHQDNFLKSKNDQHRDCKGHLGLSKKSKIIFKKLKLSKLWFAQVEKICEKCMKSTLSKIAFLG